ncbi:SMP-30/gluconolactonase/LRE family protein [Methylophaga sp.]|jgi:sugar lactone lactonase YvrE|uniref:SMP-30/gluconolactonase/LRE family protein n=1 Tax=Methylophaga sp. TaxID=2024840 RepID=UPI0014009856|nr:SMP-30/gluconolactonase/LRE family protein [Methylophaga sp.]MTI63137.1 GTP-binding protein [Methylophaga sp.]
MKLLSVLLASVLSTSIASASTTLTPAWKTTTELQAPESVIYHPGSDALYVSNVNGAPDAVDGNGYISQLSDEGEIEDLYWVDGLDAPKGLAIKDDLLYVADIDELVVIDINNKSIAARYPADQAKFLNDVAIDQQGRVYVSDMMTNQIYRLADGEFSLWMDDSELEAPNGLLVENNKLIVGSWGHMTDGFSTDVPGHLKIIDLETREIKSLGDGSPVGNLDGVEADGKGNYLVTDWMNGRLLLISPIGRSETLIEFEQGSADHTVMPEKNLVIVPMMMQNQLQAFRISHQ